MKSELAELLLKEVMREWKYDKLSDEIKDIQVISEIKYDGYQQYTHGMRYIESLALWLRQFDDCDKEVAYDFIKQKLIYISEEEMLQLVELAFPIHIKRYLINKTKEICKENSICTRDERKKVYNYYCRKSLFLGLSDGAHLDYFRRHNSFLSNEQVFVHYEFSTSKAEDMIKELQKDISRPMFIGNNLEMREEGFNSFILIDDFSASGRSYIRVDKAQQWHGKIPKFYTLLEDNEYNRENIDIHLILYIATDKAYQYIKEQTDKYFANKNVGFTIDIVQKIEPVEIKHNDKIDKLLERNYSSMLNQKYESFVDEHFEIGGGTYPYWGFADCALMLVIYHNTPNNSFPVLWYSWKEKVNALFPRITRHKEI